MASFSKVQQPWRSGRGGPNTAAQQWNSNLRQPRTTCLQTEEKSTADQVAPAAEKRLKTLSRKEGMARKEGKVEMLQCGRIYDNTIQLDEPNGCKRWCIMNYMTLWFMLELAYTLIDFSSFVLFCILFIQGISLAIFTHDRIEAFFLLTSCNL